VTGIAGRDYATKILGSKVKIKIILALMRLGEANISRIVKETSSHYYTVEKHLRELEELGIVDERRLGRVRVFSLNYENPRVPVILELIKSLNSGD